MIDQDLPVVDVFRNSIDVSLQSIVFVSVPLLDTESYLWISLLCSSLMLQEWNRCKLGDSRRTLSGRYIKL